MSFKFTLVDSETGQTLEGVAELRHGTLELGFVGFGDAGTTPGYGRPIAVELHEGKLRLLYNDDIKDENVKIVDMSNAAEPACKQLLLDRSGRQYRETMIVEPAEFDLNAQRCREPSADLPRDTAVFDREIPFADGKRMAVQVCTPTDPTAESCWTQGVLYDPTGTELACTEVGESFGGEYQVAYDDQEYVVDVRRNDLAKEPK